MRRALTAMALAAALAGGCADEPQRTVEEDRLTREAYVREADAICVEYDRRLDALPEPEDVRDVATLAEEAFPIAQEGIAKLRELRPPEELEPQVEAWLRANDQNARNIHRLQEAAERNDARRVQEIASEAADNERRADELAKGIGLGECAEAEESRERR